MTIEDFLKARIAEDERIAEWSTAGPSYLERDWESVMYGDGHGGNVESVADSANVFLAPELGRTS
ncbi:hypothetical protein ACFXON_24780, partial [Bacillus subtilis]